MQFKPPGDFFYTSNQRIPSVCKNNLLPNVLHINQLLCMLKMKSLWKGMTMTIAGGYKVLNLHDLVTDLVLLII